MQLEHECGTQLEQGQL